MTRKKKPAPAGRKQRVVPKWAIPEPERSSLTEAERQELDRIVKTMQLRKFKEYGKDIHLHAHKLSDQCQQILREHGFGDADDVMFRLFVLPSTARKTVPVPITLLTNVVAILSSMPGPRGRPRNAITVEAIKLADESEMADRAIAKLLAARTGEPVEKIRSALRSAKRRSK